MYISNPRAKAIELQVSLLPFEGAQTVDVRALVDSGATGNFVDRDLVKRRGWTMECLKTPLRAYDVDGSHNEAGVLRHKVSLLLRIGETEEKAGFLRVKLWKRERHLGNALAQGC